MPISAPFDAMSASVCAPGGFPNVLDTMKITRPKPRSRIPGAKAFDRLCEPIGDIAPSEYEALHYATAIEPAAWTAGPTELGPRGTPARLMVT